LPNQPSPEAVIFDIGNVLITWHPERLYDTLLSKKNRRTMFAAVDLHTMNDKVDHGKDWRETVFHRRPPREQQRGRGARLARAFVLVAR